VYAAVKNDFHARAVFVARTDAKTNGVFKSDARFANIYDKDDWVYLVGTGKSNQ
jgi:hypothetical protein